MDFFRGKQWDIIGNMKWWFILSGITILAGIIALATMGLNFGIDFTGGSMLRFQFASPVAGNEAEVPQVVSKVREILIPLKLESSEIQVLGNQQGVFDQLYLRTPPVQNDEAAIERSNLVLDGLKQLYPDKGEIKDLGRETVGPVVGEELRNKTIIALVVGLLLIMIYIAIRYDGKFAIAAIVGLLHDAFVVFGCMALFQVELNSGFVAALLTVLGYSNHDTVVIFDRIRENMRVHRRATYAETVNASILETLARSVNIVLTVLFTIVALLLFGGPAIHGFSMALLFGTITGCYSSIFAAAPIVVLLEERALRIKAAQLAARGRGGAAAGTTPRPTRPAAAKATNGDTASEVASNGRVTLERLQKEEMDSRQVQAEAESEAKREERRQRRKQEKDREASKTKNKRRF